MPRFQINQDESEEDCHEEEEVIPKKSKKPLTKNRRPKGPPPRRYAAEEEEEEEDHDSFEEIIERPRRQKPRQPRFTPHSQSSMAMGVPMPVAQSFMAPHPSVSFMPMMPGASFMQMAPPMMSPMMANPFYNAPSMMPFPGQPYPQQPFMGDDPYCFEDDYERQPRGGSRTGKKSPLPLLAVGLLMILAAGGFLFKDQLLTAFSSVSDEEAPEAFEEE